VAHGTQVFHAATALVEGRLVTAGGRVLSVCAHAPSLEEARQRAYRAVDQIHFEGMQARRDIGARALRAGALRR
jgi:phosphoribosylamine-glycine ligase